MSILCDIWIIFIATAFILSIFRSRRFFRKTQRLTDTAIPTHFHWPKISVLIPACNEGSTIESAARTLLATEYPSIEFIFVNDRSSDATGEIIDQLAREDFRVKVVHINELPEGWLGKVHAMAKGMELAGGEWVLITDADVHFAKDCLKKAVVIAHTNALDFLTVAPIVQAPTWLLRVFLAHFLHLMTIFVPPGQVTQEREPGYAGYGAFLFLRKSTYERSEKFAWLRLEIIDDAGTSLMMRRAGGRLGAVSGTGEVELEWYPNAWAFVKGLEKNVFASLQFSVVTVIFSCGINAFLGTGMLIAPFYASSPWFGIAVWSSLYFTLTVFGLEARRKTPAGFGEIYCTPIAFFCFPLITLRSAVITLWNGGVRWRSTFYPLAELRAHQRLNLSKILFKKE